MRRALIALFALKKPASWKDLFFPTAYGLPGN